MNPGDHEMEFEPGPPDPDEYCPVCSKHERECQCPYDDCESVRSSTSDGASQPSETKMEL